MARSDYRFSYPKRVRFSEIDAQAVLFNARYIDYFGIGMSEYFRELRLQDLPGGSPHIQFARTEIDYRAPIRLEEMIDICIRCARVGTKSIALAFEFHGEGADDLRCTGESVIVHLRGVGEVSSPVPPDMVALFEAYEGRSLRA